METGRNIDTNLHFRRQAVLSRENGVTGVNGRIVGKKERRKRRKRKRLRSVGEKGLPFGERLGGSQGHDEARDSDERGLPAKEGIDPSPHY